MKGHVMSVVYFTYDEVQNKNQKIFTLSACFIILYTAVEKNQLSDLIFTIIFTITISNSTSCHLNKMIFFLRINISNNI